MTARKNIFSRIRLVYRPSSTLLKCVVLAAVVLSTVCLMALRGSILENQRLEEAYRQEAATLEQKNDQLAEYIAELGTVQSLKRIATEKLGLVTPDTIIFLPEEQYP